DFEISKTISRFPFRFGDLQNDFEISIPIWRSPKRFRDFYSDLEISKTISRFPFRFRDLQNDLEICIAISRSPERFGDLHHRFRDLRARFQIMLAGRADLTWRESRTCRVWPAAGWVSGCERCGRRRR